MKKLLITLIFFISASLAPCFAQQQFGGIGAQLFLDTMGGHTMPCIQGLVANSSAEKYLRVTDFIIKVNDVSCLDKNIQDVVSMIRGEVGTTVHVTVADTKEGKNPREYDLMRGSIQLQSQSPALPSLIMVNKEKVYDSIVTQLKKAGSTIIKTFPSECGDYFFNFNAEPGSYHIKVVTIAGLDASEKAFYITGRVFDNDNEAAATSITQYKVTNPGGYNLGQLDGAISFTKKSVGTINVQRHNEEKECSGMFVIIYKG